MLSFDKHNYLMTSENYFDIYPFPMKTMNTENFRQKTKKLCNWITKVVS